MNKVIPISIKNEALSEVNNPVDYDKLSEYQKYVLHEWIKKHLEPYKIKTYQPHHSSYSLKHLFQRSGGFYVTNGQFKAGMLKAGFIPKEFGAKNWTFKLGKKIDSI